MKTLKNYTSTVPANKTISQIEEQLAAIGATHIIKDYANGVVTGISFSIPHNGKAPAFQIPARIDVVYKVITKGKRIQARSIESYKEQSQRTAWRIIYDWVSAQCAMVRLEQAEALQVFLPYLLVKKGETLYQKVSTGGLNLLGSGD